MRCYFSERDRPKFERIDLAREWMYGESGRGVYGCPIAGSGVGGEPCSTGGDLERVAKTIHRRHGSKSSVNCGLHKTQNQRLCDKDHVNSAMLGSSAGVPSSMPKMTRLPSLYCRGAYCGYIVDNPLETFQMRAEELKR